jgi:hypothetical protein
LKRLLSQSSFTTSGTARVECLLHPFREDIFVVEYGLYKTFAIAVFLIISLPDMPRGFNRRFIRHGLPLCTSAIGTGFLGRHLLEVN